jgi:CDGSH-type Zn-finger protein
MSTTPIRTLDNGPLLVTGSETLSDADGGACVTEQETIALCRCGHAATSRFATGPTSATGSQTAAAPTAQAGGRSRG